MNLQDGMHKRCKDVPGTLASAHLDRLVMHQFEDTIAVHAYVDRQNIHTVT